MCTAAKSEITGSMPIGAHSVSPIIIINASKVYRDVKNVKIIPVLHLSPALSSGYSSLGDVTGTKVDVYTCEDENHSTSTFEMMECIAWSRLVVLTIYLRRMTNIDECIKNIVNSNFYREFSYADWLHRLANLLAHIWEELDNNIKLYGDIVSYEAQYGEHCSAFLVFFNCGQY
ncbi:hypothetical protein ACTXT7_014741 [Hymenolepis weldensis]